MCANNSLTEFNWFQAEYEVTNTILFIEIKVQLASWVFEPTVRLWLNILTIFVYVCEYMWVQVNTICMWAELLSQLNAINFLQKI